MIKYPEVRPLDSIQNQGNLKEEVVDESPKVRHRKTPKLSKHDTQQHNPVLDVEKHIATGQGGLHQNEKLRGHRDGYAHVQIVVCKNWEVLLPANLPLIFLVGVNRFGGSRKQTKSGLCEVSFEWPVSPGRRDKGLTCAPSTAARQSSRSRRVTRTICPIEAGETQEQLMSYELMQKCLENHSTECTCRMPVVIV